MDNNKNTPTQNLSSVTLNPGSPEAVKSGCTCPVMDNHNGEGCGYIDDEGNVTFIYNMGCKIHGNLN